MTKSQIILFRILFVLYLAAVLYLCFGHFEHIPSVKRSFWGIPSDKLVHFCMFFPFPIIAYLAFDQFTETVPQTLLFTGVTLVLGLLLAMGTELGQAKLTHHRSGDSFDFLADSLAIAISSIIVFFLDVRKQKK